MSAEQIAGRRPDGESTLRANVDGELLRVIAHAALLNIDQLIAEGLHSEAVEKVTTHAMALTAKVIDLMEHPDRQRAHALGLWDLLSVLSGPVSTALLYWLDDAIGSAP